MQVKKIVILIYVKISILLAYLLKCLEEINF
jgi:hypothetical protein